MDSNDLQAKWNELKGEIRSQWGKLTDDDIERIAGNKDRLIDMVQERYGYVWDEARQMVDRYLDDFNGLRSQAADELRSVASKEKLQKVRNDVTAFVRRYPIPSLLIGLGIGYLLARRSERSVMPGETQRVPKPTLLALVRGIVDDAKQLVLGQYELRKY